MSRHDAAIAVLKEELIRLEAAFRQPGSDIFYRDEDLLNGFELAISTLEAANE